jgi:thioredoxin-like negative regulator of GroEL
VIERFLVTLALILLGLLAYWGLRRRLVYGRRRRALGFDEFDPGRPAILLFSTPDCVPCKTVQRPAIAEVVERYQGSVQFIEIDAYQRESLAASWGVLTVPTTFIIDSMGRPRGVNMGVARASRLMAQLQKIGETPRKPSQETELALGD